MARTPKQRVSAQEVELTRTAFEKDARYNSAFRPLEQQAIRELDSADAGKRGAMLAGRTVADLNQQAEGMGMPPIRPGVNIASGGTKADAATNVRAIGAATSAGVTDGFTMGRNSIDADRLNVIATGQNVTRASQAGFTQAARLENARARSILDSKRVVDHAKGAALGDIVTAGIARHSMEKSNATRRDIGFEDGKMVRGDYSVPDDQLNFYSRWLRARNG